VTAVGPILAVADDLQRLDEPAQLARLEQVLRARGPAAVARVLARERLAQQQAARRKRPHEHGKDRPVKVVEDENEIVRVLAERHVRRLEVEHLGRHGEVEASRERPQRVDARGVEVHRADEGARLREDERVATAAARDVEGARSARREPRVLEEPGRGPRRPGPLVAERALPAAKASREVVHAGHAGLREERRGAARAHAVAVHHEDRAAVVGNDGRGRGQAVHREEQRAGQVPFPLERGGRSHVEDARSVGDEPEGFVGSHVLVTPGAGGYSGGQRQDA
jgi:hypothetical protein